MMLSLARLSPKSAVALTALAALSLAAARPTAAQTLINQPVNVSLKSGTTGPTSFTINDDGTQTVTAGGATFNDAFAGLSVLVTPTQVVFTNTENDPVGFDANPDYFFGYGVAETGSSPATITGLSIDPATTVTGFDPSRLSFTPTAAFANFNDFGDTANGFEFGAGQSLTLDVSFASPPPSAAPEPSAVAVWAFVGLGAAGLVLKARKKKVAA